MSDDSRLGSASRCLALVVAATMVLICAWWWLRPDLSNRPGVGSLEQILAQLGALVAALCVTWGWAVTTVTALSATFARAGDHPPDAPARSWGCPAGLQRAILTICGVSLVTGPLVGLGAATQAADPGTGPSIVQGLPLPDRPTSPTSRPRRHRSLSGPGSPTSGPGPGHVVVRPGDFLWAIAAVQLPRDCGDVTIDREWRRIYDLNRSLIGADPDLIRPGQTLAIPTQETNR